MQHPGFLLLPLLMLSDYLLTIAGARLRLETYERHFRTEHYELNPIWQQAVAKLRWLNPRHLLLTIVLSAIILFCVEWVLPDEDIFVDVLEGALFGLFGAVNGRHVGNLATFAYLKRHPDAIDGRVTMSHEFVLWTSTFQYLAFVVPAALLAICLPQPMVLGFFAGSVMLLAVHFGWILRGRRKRTQRARA